MKVRTSAIPMRILLSKLLAWCLLATAFAHGEGMVTQVKSTQKTPSKALVTLEFKNTYAQGVKSFKAMLLLKDASGKLVDVQSRWLFGSTPDTVKPEILASSKALTTNVVLNSAKPFDQIEVFPTRIILEDGTTLSPKAPLPAAAETQAPQAPKP